MGVELVVVYVVVPILLVLLAAVIYLILRHLGIITIDITSEILKADMEDEKMRVESEEVIEEKDGETTVTKTIRKFSRVDQETGGVKKYLAKKGKK